MPVVSVLDCRLMTALELASSAFRVTLPEIWSVWLPEKFGDSAYVPALTTTRPDVETAARASATVAKALVPKTAAWFPGAIWSPSTGWPAVGVDASPKLEFET